MKKKVFVFVGVAFVLTAFVITGCVSTQKKSASEIYGITECLPPMEELLGKTRTELESFLGLYLDMDGNSGTIQGYPNAKQLCAFYFEDGKVVRCEALFISTTFNMFDYLVNHNIELLGEPLKKDANLIMWEIKPGIFGFINNPHLQGASGATIGVADNNKSKW